MSEADASGTLFRNEKEREESLMLSNTTVKKALDELSEITKVELALYDCDGVLIAASGKELLVESKDEDRIEETVDPEILASFIDSAAESQEIGRCHLMKIEDEGKDCYILVSCGEGNHAHMVGKIAVCQLRTLITAFKEKYDRNNYFQNLLLDNLLLVDIYNRAKRLHIPVEARRIVYLIETKLDRENTVIYMMRNLFSQQNGDYITSVDEKSIILIKTLSQNEDEEQIHQIAGMILDMLNTEAMLNARIAYGTAVSELREVSKSYKEAQMALEVGKIFHAQERVISYRRLGIGRLIYQLPEPLCRMFMQEIFGESLPESLDEETLATIMKFFENSLNVSETARQLFIHRNTLVYRIEKLQKETGLDIRIFDDALTFNIALMVIRYLKYLDSRNQ